MRVTTPHEMSKFASPSVTWRKQLPYRVVNSVGLSKERNHDKKYKLSSVRTLLKTILLLYLLMVIGRRTLWLCAPSSARLWQLHDFASEVQILIPMIRHSLPHPFAATSHGMVKHMKLLREIWSHRSGCSGCFKD